MRKPLVSVVINTRNRCKILPRAIESVIGQTYSNIELIIVDGHSTDETKAVVSAYQNKVANLKYLYVDNEDMSAAQCLNMGFRDSKGEFIAILDDDDEYLPSKIEKQVELFVNSSERVGIIYCWEEFYDDRKKIKLHENKPNVKGNAYFRLLERSCVGGGTTMMFRKSVIDLIGGFDESIRFGADYQFNINVAKYYEHDFVPEILVRTHINHGYERMTSMKLPTMKYIDYIEYVEKILHDHNDAFEKKPTLRYYHYRNILHSAAKIKNWKIFYKYLILGFKLNISKKEKLFYFIRGIKHLIFLK